MIVDVTVVPNSRSFSLTLKGNRLKISLKSPAENNRANIELVKELSKLLGKPIRIISGQTSRRKKLSIDIEETEWKNYLVIWDSKKNIQKNNQKFR